MRVDRKSRVGAFFFSSRRRHTRYIGDWSSDVCSSDLKRVAEMIGSWRSMGYELGLGIGIAQGYATIGAIGYEGRRSEERRVGKECRARWVEERSGGKMTLHVASIDLTLHRREARNVTE